MRLSWIPLAFFAAFTAAQNETAQEKLEAALQLVLTMPTCAVRSADRESETEIYQCLLTHVSQQQCLVQAVAASGKSAEQIDITASCTNETATAGIEACALVCFPRNGYLGR
jgi:BarA-like signal transduction histidine kinase